MSFLNRKGKKSRIAKNIQSYFPKHDFYFEPFFGAGGMFFNKMPKSAINFLNDNDGDVFNLFQVFMDRNEELLELIRLTPYDTNLFKHWLRNKEDEPLRKAMRFLYLSNYSLYGSGDCIKIGGRHCKRNLIKRFLETTIGEDCQFLNVDFRKFFKSVGLEAHGNIRVRGFVYADPPYLGTGGNYKGFTEQDTSDLFDTLQESNMRFAMSEFDHPFVMNEAQKRGLNIITIGERVNIKNRRMEILITNYGIENNGIELYN